MAARLTIIGSFVSPYVRKVLACINLKQLAYEVDPITPFFGSDGFERLSPLRRIPVLIDGDLSISDSTVICEYLDEAYPGHPLLPADPRDRARARWPRTAGFVGRTLSHSCIDDLLRFEDVQRNAAIKGRRQALLDAGAPLSDESWGAGQPRKGYMTL